MTEATYCHGSIPFSFPGLRRVRCLFSTVAAGNMSLDTTPGERGQSVNNRKRLMQKAGFSTWAEVFQVHGDAIVSGQGDADVGKTPQVQADGQFTFEKSRGLIVKSADCQPILIARADGGAVAALHVGWRGNAMNFPGTAVAHLCREFSCLPGDLLAVRGPSLGPTASEFVNFAKEWPPEFLSWYDGEHKTVNLWTLTQHQLREAGVSPERIFSLDLCTHTMSEDFFSYRRKDAGRQISVIWME